jgi:hypothetical protein
MQSIIIYTPYDKRKWLHFTPLFMHCKVPLFAAVFSSQLLSFHLKYTFPINLQSTNKISQFIFTFDIETTKSYHHTLLSQSDINNFMVQILEFLIEMGFFFTHHKFYGQIVFFLPISCMKWFLSPIKNLYKELFTIYDGLLTK